MTEGAGKQQALASGTHQGLSCASKLILCLGLEGLKGAEKGASHPVLTAGLLERAEHQCSTAAILQMAGQVLPSHSAHATLVGARNRQPWALVLMALGPETEAVVNNWTPCFPISKHRSIRASPGWCQKQTPWYSRHKAGCAWGTQKWHAGPTVASSCGHHTCSHSIHSPGGTCPRDSKNSTGAELSKGFLSS